MLQITKTSAMLNFSPLMQGNNRDHISRKESSYYIYDKTTFTFGYSSMNALQELKKN